MWNSFSFAQQATEFVELKNYFDHQRSLIRKEFSGAFQKEEDLNKKKDISKYYDLFVHKLDSIQNSAYLGAIIKVRNREDVSRTEKSNNQYQSEIDQSSAIVKPTYPGGISQLNSDLNDLFYRDFFNDLSGEFNARIEFTIREDGSVAYVNTEGDNMPFNNQATIALYLLPNKFEPALYKGKPIAYQYQLPIKFTIE